MSEITYKQLGKAMARHLKSSSITIDGKFFVEARNIRLIGCEPLPADSEIGTLLSYIEWLAIQGHLDGNGDGFFRQFLSAQ